MDDKYTAQFTVTETGNTTGEKVTGLFKVKTRLSFRDQLRRDELRRQILGMSPNGTTAYARAASLAEMFSEIGVRVLDAPKWWTNAENGMDLFDDNIAVAVHGAALKAEQAEIDKATGKGEEAKKDLAKEAGKVE